MCGQAKTAELFELPFGIKSGVGQMGCVLDGCGHWRHLTSTVEQMCTPAMPVPKLLEAVLL